MWTESPISYHHQNATEINNTDLSFNSEQIMDLYFRIEFHNELYSKGVYIKLLTNKHKLHYAVLLSCFVVHNSLEKK